MDMHHFFLPNENFLHLNPTNLHKAELSKHRFHKILCNCLLLIGLKSAIFKQNLSQNKPNPTVEPVLGALHLTPCYGIVTPGCHGTQLLLDCDQALLSPLPTPGWNFVRQEGPDKTHGQTITVHGHTVPTSYIREPVQILQITTRMISAPDTTAWSLTRRFPS